MNNCGKKISTSSDYLTEVVKGNIAGADLRVISAGIPSLGALTEETIWDQGGLYTYLTADTTLYASSTSASDTAVTLACFGVNDEYEQIVRTVTLNGQNQVELSGQMFRVLEIVVTGSTAPLGDIYIAESDTLTGGVPDTESKIKSKVILGNNKSKNGFYTVPKDKYAIVVDILYSAPKNRDVCFSTFSKNFGGLMILNFSADIYQNTEQIAIQAKYDEKTDFEVRGLATNEGTLASFLVRILLIDK